MSTSSKQGTDKGSQGRTPNTESPLLSSITFTPTSKRSSQPPKPSQNTVKSPAASFLSTSLWPQSPNPSGSPSMPQNNQPQQRSNLAQSPAKTLGPFSVTYFKSSSWGSHSGNAGSVGSGSNGSGSESPPDAGSSLKSSGNVSKESSLKKVNSQEANIHHHPMKKPSLIALSQPVQAVQLEGRSSPVAGELPRSSSEEFSFPSLKVELGRSPKTSQDDIFVSTTTIGGVSSVKKHQRQSPSQSPVLFSFTRPSLASAPSTLFGPLETIPPDNNQDKDTSKSDKEKEREVEKPGMPFKFATATQSSSAGSGNSWEMRVDKPANWMFSLPRSGLPSSGPQSAAKQPYHPYRTTGEKPPLRSRSAGKMGSTTLEFSGALSAEEQEKAINRRNSLETNPEKEKELNVAEGRLPQVQGFPLGKNSDGKLTHKRSSSWMGSQTLFDGDENDSKAFDSSGRTPQAGASENATPSQAQKPVHRLPFAVHPYLAAHKRQGSLDNTRSDAPGESERNINTSGPVNWMHETFSPFTEKRSSLTETIQESAAVKPVIKAMSRFAQNPPSTSDGAQGPPFRTKSDALASERNEGIAFKQAQGAANKSKTVGSGKALPSLPNLPNLPNFSMSSGIGDIVNRVFNIEQEADEFGDWNREARQNTRMNSMILTKMAQESERQLKDMEDGEKTANVEEENVEGAAPKMEDLGPTGVDERAIVDMLISTMSNFGSIDDDKSSLDLGEMGAIIVQEEAMGGADFDSNTSQSEGVSKEASIIGQSSGTIPTSNSRSASRGRPRVHFPEDPEGLAEAKYF